MKKKSSILHILVLVCLLAVTLLDPQDGHAARAKGGTWWGNQTQMTINLNRNSPNPTVDWNALAVSALNEWGIVPGTSFRFAPGLGDEDECNRVNFLEFSNVVEWNNFVTNPNGTLTTTCGDTLDANTVAATFITEFLGFKNNADVLFNVNLPWTSKDPGFVLTPIDFSSVAIHEFGHVLEIDHEARE